MRRFVVAWQRAKGVLFDALPLALVGMVYVGMKPLANVGISPSRVHACDLQDLERRVFGLDWGGARMTLHEWLAPHRSLALDLLFALPYGTFVLAVVAAAAFLYFRDRAALRRFTWAFLVLNVAGFLTYHLYPAAPPWYVHAHGCVVDLATPASAGPALSRVDALLGVPYFAWLYGRSSCVFGAMPSLHVAYPLLIAIAGWRAFGRAGRAAAVLYVLWMGAAAVYLDHHWLLDVLAGAVYGGAAIAVVGAAKTLRWRIAVWFGCGLSPIAPGTAGTLGAVPLYLLIRPLGWLAVLSATLTLTALGVWSASAVAADTHTRDPQIVVVDEVAGFFVTMLAASSSWQSIALGFCFFRFFDVGKPWPARVAERLPGGWGIVLDDVVAGTWAALVLFGLRELRLA